MSRKEQQQFEAWVASMDDVLEEFKELLPPVVAAKLDSTPQSLTALEAWVLQNYANIPAVKAEPNTTKIDGAVRYLGEVFRSHLGGHWEIRFTNPKDINNAIPIIVGYPGQQTPIAPHRLLTACTDRRTGEYFLTVFRNQAELAKR